MYIYKWKQHKIDYGERMCELLFISSGLLFIYNNFKRAMPPTDNSSCKYTYKHLRSFYPLHIINSLYYI